MKKFLRPCPVCGGERGDVLHHQRFAVSDDYPLPDEYDVVICADVRHGVCRHARDPGRLRQVLHDLLDLRAASRSLGRHNSSGRSGTAGANRSACSPSHIPSKQARILDVGCANGGLLQVLGRSGILQSGRSRSFACLRGKYPQRCGYQSYRGDLAHLPAEMGRFDAVILTSVLEHVLDVKSAISALASVCTDDGRIFLEVPDAAGYADYLHAPFQDINTEHINHFSTAALRNLMAQFGFTPVLEKRVVVTGPSGLMFPGLEVGYERRAGHVQQPWVIDHAFRGQMERYIHESRAMMQGIDQRLQGVLAASNRGDCLGDRTVDHEAAVRHGAEGCEGGRFRGWESG